MYFTNILLCWVIAITAVAAYADHRWGTIPVWVLVASTLGGPALHLVLAYASFRGHWSGPLVIVGMGFLACGVVPFILWRAQAMGGGDVKLLAGLGATLGIRHGLELELYAFLLGSLFIASKMAYEGKLLRLLANSSIVATNPLRSVQNRRSLPQEALTEFPFGPSLFAGAVVFTIAQWRGL